MNHNPEMLAKIRELNSLLTGVATVEDLLAHGAAFIARAYDLNLVGIFVNFKGQNFSFEYDADQATGRPLTNSELKFIQGQIIAKGELIHLPQFVKRAEVSKITAHLQRDNHPRPASFCIVPILHLGTLHGWIECQSFRKRRSWTSAQRLALHKCAMLLADALDHSFSESTRAMDDASTVELHERSNHSAWVVIDLFSNGKLLRASRGLVDVAGFDFESVRGNSIYEFVDRLLIASEREQAYAQIESVLSKKAQRVEFYTTIRNELSGNVCNVRFQIEQSWAHSKRVTLVISSITSGAIENSTVNQERLHSIRLIEYGNLIILRTDLQLNILDIIGDTKKIIGIPAEELRNNSNVWNQLLKTDDFRRLAIKMRAMGDKPREFEHEIQITNMATTQQHYLFLTAIPLFSASGAHIGWEGYGLDTTEKRRAEHEMLQQNRRIQALYEIARTTQSNMDPAFVALHGLKALMSATKSVFAHCVLYDRSSDTLEILATVGCDQKFVEELIKVLDKPNLARDVISANRGLLIDDLRSSPRARYGISARAGAKSCIVMPLVYEMPEEGRVVIGAIQISSRRIAKYTQDDFELVAAAAAQIAAHIRQAEYQATEKREASSLATLYKLSHVLTRVKKIEEIADQAFPIIMSEITCRRLWLGVVNEAGTHIAGVGGYGPGVNERLANIQIELQLRHDFIDQVIQTRQAIVVPAGTTMECSALNAIIAKLKLGTLVVIPLVTLGKVVGLMVLEPIMPASGYLSRKLSLLLSMANEMATVVLARRLEEKMLISEKMRVAGLLASGVAHNFNNLLQAVLGQASLLELQIPNNSPLKASVHMIKEAAERGSQLIKKMLSLSDSSPEKRQEIAIAEFISNEKDLLISLLGKDIKLKIDITTDLPKVNVDTRQLQQVFSSLLVNAREALLNRQLPTVELTAQKVRLHTGEIDPDLAPGEYLTICIKDNGRGMQAEQVKRCFEPFFSSKNVDQRSGIGFEGSGFGLALSYSMVKQHGGTIIANSQVEVGSEFTIYLPAALKQVINASVTSQVEKITEKSPNQTLASLVSNEPTKSVSQIKGNYEK